MANRFLSNITINDAYTFPSADGDNGQIITTDGSGNLSFTDISNLAGAQSNFVYYDVKNSSGATINKGAAVMAVGTDGNSGHILIDEMVADGSIEPKYFMGVLESTLANGEIGRVIHFGELDQLNTSTFQDGDVLWCDPATPGGFTTTEPLGPNLKLAAAIVINASTNGKIKVRVQGNAGIHELHDVKITTQANGDLLQWNNTTSVWENKTLASIADSRYVNVSGDTMTGDLYLQNSDIFLDRSSLNGTGSRRIRFTEQYSSAGYQGAYIYYNGDNNRFYIGTHHIANSDSANDVYAIQMTRGTGDVEVNNNLTAAAIIKRNGTSSQFLKADGSVDSTSYAPTNQSIWTFTTERNFINIDTAGSANYWSYLHGVQTTDGTHAGAYQYVVSFGDKSHGIQFSHGYGNLADSLKFRAGTDNSSSENGANVYTDWRHIATREWVNAQGFLDALPSHNHDADYVNVSGDTMTGLLNLRGGTSANNFLQRLGAGGGSGNYSTLDFVKTADTDGDFMFMAYHAGIGNTTSSPKIIFGHYAPTPTDGHVMTIDTKNKRVGIGNTSPAYKLDILGGNLRVVNDNPLLILSDDNNTVRYSGIQLNTNGGSWYLSNGATMDTSLSNLYISRNTTGDLRFIFHRDNYYFGVFDNTNTVQAAISAQGDSFFNGGDVGIGTTTPAAKLDVRGGALFVGDYTATVTPTDGIWIERPAGNETQIQMYTYGSSVFKIKSDGLEANIGWASSKDREVNFVNTGAGDIKVGIGTSSPASKLNIVSTSADATALIVQDPDRKIKIGRDSIQVTDSTDSVSNLYLNGSGGNVSIPVSNLAIGKTSPSYKLDVNGDINSTGLYINDVDQISGARFFEPLAYEDAYTRTTTSNSTDEWVKVISYSGSPRRIRLSLYHGGDNTNAYDEYLISHSSYGMQTHIFRLPGSKYNTSKILGVKAINPTAAVQEIWVKVAGVINSNGTFSYRSNVAVLSNANVIASAQASEPASTTGSSVITFNSNDRDDFTTISSGGAKLFGSLSTPSVYATNLTGSNQLELNASASYIRLRANSNNIFYDAGGDHYFRTANGASTSMIITSNGDVGIGEPVPTAKLHVAGSALITDNLDFGIGGFLGTSTSVFEMYSLGSIIYNADSNNNGQSQHIFRESGNEIVRFNHDGNVGIDQGIPKARLHVGSDGTNAYSSTITKGTNMKGIMATLSNNADDMVGIYFATGTTTEGTHWSGITGSRSDNATDWSTQLNFYTHDETVTDLDNATQKMVIKGNGNVGIGITTPSDKLHVHEASNSSPSVIRLSNNVASGDNGISVSQIRTFIEGTTELARIEVQNDLSSHDDGNIIFSTRDGFNNVFASRLTIDTSGLVVNGDVEATDFIANGNVDISGTLTVDGLSEFAGAIRITESGTAQRILIGNQDSAGVNTPAIIMGVNGSVRFGYGDSWSGEGGNFTEKFKVDSGGMHAYGNINFNATERGLVWTMNTDGAYIKFFNTGDADTNSRLEYATSDNGNEYHRFVIAGNEKFQINNFGVNVTGSATATSFVKSGGTSSQFLKADGSVDSSAYLTSYTETDTLQSVTDRGSSSTNTIVLSNSQPIHLTNTGTGTYNKTVIYQDSSNGFYVDSAKATDDGAAARLPMTFTWRGGYAANGGLILNGNTGLYTTDTGLGIGTNDPKSKLHVAKAGNSNGGSMLIGLGGSATDKWSFLAGAHYNQDTGSGNGVGSAGVALIGCFSDIDENRVHIGGNPYEINAATSIHFNTHTSSTSTLGGSERMRITSGGNVGIGTTNPIGKLQVGAHTFAGGNGVYADARIGSYVAGSLTSMIYASTYNDPTFPDYGMVFVHGPNTSSYNVWSISPDGPAKGDSLNFIYGSNATNIHVVTPKVVFDGNGNVGIGVTNPSQKLDVNGVGIFGNYDNYRASLDGTSAGAFLRFGTSADIDSLGTIGTYGSAMTYESGQTLGHVWKVGAGVNGTQVMRLTGGGRLGLGTDSPTLKFDLSSSDSFGLPAMTGTTPVGFARIGYNDRSWGGNEILMGIINGGHDYAGYIQCKVPTNYAFNRAFLINPLGGKVGIGTQTPISQLHVQGSGSYNWNVASEYLPSDATIVSSEMSNDQYNSILQLVSVRQSLTTGSASQGFLGFSTVDDSNGQGIRDAARIAIVNESTAARNSSTALSFWTNSGGTNTNPATEKMRINSAGNITYVGYQQSSGYPSQGDWAWHWHGVRYTGFLGDTRTKLYEYFYNNTAALAAETYVDTFNINAEASMGANIWGDVHLYHSMFKTYIYVKRTFTVTNAQLNGDDPYALWVDGTYVAGRDSCCTATPYTYTFTVGWHKIELIYSEGGGGHYVQLGWNPKDYTAYIAAMNPHGPVDLYNLGGFSYRDGKLGIGRKDPSYSLDVNGIGRIGSSSTVGELYFTTNAGNYIHYSGTSVYFKTAGGKHYFEGNSTYKGAWEDNGYLGVGNTSPSYMLDVSGSVRATGTVHIDSTTPLIFTGAGNATYTLSAVYCNTSNFVIEAPLTSDSAGAAHVPLILTWRGGFSQGGLKLGGSTQLVTNDSGLGINVASPSYSLEVSGQAHFQNTLSVGSGQEIRIGGSSDGNHYLKKIGTGYSGVNIDGPQLQGHQGGELSTNYTGNNWALRWAIGGNVFVNNTFTAGGDVIAYGSSDKRLKDNIKPIPNAIDKVQSIGGYEFDWNDKQETYEGHDVGVIAQEVEEILPEVVTTREDGYKAVKYEKLVPLLIEAIKEQQKQIDELKQIINKK